MTRYPRTPHVIAAAAFALVLLGGCSSAALAAPVLRVSPASSVADVGESLTLDIVIDDVIDLYAWQFDLSFDPVVLQADDILEGAFLASGGTTFFVPGFIDNALGIIPFTAASLIGAVPGMTGDGPLATLAFTALGSGLSSIMISNVVLLDSFLSEVVDIGLVNGSVTVRERMPVPEPSAGILMLLGAGAVMAKECVWAGKSLHKVQKG